jgi:hypothetical protein
MNRIEKFEFVEIYVPSGSTATRWAFPDLPKLRYTALLAMEYYSVSAIPNAPSGRALISVANAQKAYLTLYADERQDIYRVPLYSMNRIQASTDPFVRPLSLFKGQKITWDKSYVEFTTLTAPGADQSICFGVYYA